MGHAELRELSVNSVVSRWPATMPVFQRFGIDMCCGGWMSVERAAGEAGVRVDDLCAALLDVVRAAEPGGPKNQEGWRG